MAQVELSGEAMGQALRLWPYLDAADVAGSRGRWLALNVALVRLYQRRSAGMASLYLTQFREAEGFPGGPIVGADTFDAVWATKALDGGGPGSLLHRVVKYDLTGPDAKAGATSDMLGAVQKQTLQGGRRVVDESTLANPRSVGWRRVSDGSPCGFCALMASRGPVFKTASSAGVGRHWHSKCGCSVEEVFGDWDPTPTEKQFDGDYEKAAQAATAAGRKRTASAVLAEMRKLGYR